MPYKMYVVKAIDSKSKSWPCRATSEKGNMGFTRGGTVICDACIRSLSAFVQEENDKVKRYPRRKVHKQSSAATGGRDIKNEPSG
jgi:hypothetical protein